MKTQNLIHLLLIATFLFLSENGFTQISKGGTPPSFTTSIQDSVSVIQMPAVNIDSLVQSDTVGDFRSVLVMQLM